MLIENRISIWNEQIVVYWEKLVIEIFSKRFFRTKEVGKKQFRQLRKKFCILHSVFCIKETGADKSVNYKTKRSFNLQPKKTICELKQLKPKEIFPNGEYKQKAVQAKKSVRWMPWQWEPMKDAITCEKPRWGGNNLWPVDLRMGKPLWRRAIDP